jgi:nucleoid DNA-binding protein
MKPKNRTLKTDLIEDCAASLGITYSNMEKGLNTVLNYIVEKLREGKKVQLSGFGSFSVSHRRARIGHNPRTGKPIEIPELNTTKFVGGEGFKEAIKLRK